MSKNYSAGQFDDAFAPTRLGNWEATEKLSEDPRSRDISRPLEPIVDEKGHLLPGFARKKDPWGPPEQKPRRVYASTQGLTSRLPPLTSKSKRFSMSKMQKQRQKMRKENKNTNTSLLDMSSQLGPACQHYLQEIKPPVIWILGYPVQSIAYQRREYVKELAKRLKFEYIELADELVNWSNRAQAITLDSPQASPTHRNKKNPNRIIFDTQEKFRTYKIMELLKYAMIEKLPCNGFIIDSFPCNVEEAKVFEYRFYPAVIGILFEAGAPEKVCGRIIRRKDDPNFLPPEKNPIIHPKEFTRQHYYSPRDEVQLGKVFGRKTIRVLTTENLDIRTRCFVYELLKTNIKNHDKMEPLTCDLDFDDDQQEYEITQIRSSRRRRGDEFHEQDEFESTCSFAYTVRPSAGYTDLNALRKLHEDIDRRCEVELQAPFNTPCDKTCSGISNTHDHRRRRRSSHNSQKQDAADAIESATRKQKVRVSNKSMSLPQVAEARYLSDDETEEIDGDRISPSIDYDKNKGPLVSSKLADSEIIKRILTAAEDISDDDDSTLSPPTFSDSETDTLKDIEDVCDDHDDPVNLNDSETLKETETLKDVEDTTLDQGDTLVSSKAPDFETYMETLEKNKRQRPVVDLSNDPLYDPTLTDGQMAMRIFEDLEKSKQRQLKMDEELASIFEEDEFELFFPSLSKSTRGTRGTPIDMKAFGDCKPGKMGQERKQPEQVNSGDVPTKQDDKLKQEDWNNNNTRDNGQNKTPKSKSTSSPSGIGICDIGRGGQKNPTPTGEGGDCPTPTRSTATTRTKNSSDFQQQQMFLKKSHKKKRTSMK